MAFSINEFKSQLVYGGARSALFKVFITNPISGVADFKVPFMVEASSLPSSRVGVIPVPYFGRLVKFGGDREFDPWRVVVINDEDFAIRNAMEAWSNAINTHSSNFRANPAEYKSQAQVIQYAKDGTVLREYTFEGLFPVDVSEVPLNWGDQNQIERFQVTFDYDLWRNSGGTTGSSTS